jgi:uncharacterized protein YndB with AHSA1/START domain
MRNTITVETTVNMPLEKAWEYWNDPKHVTQWNAASSDWHTPRAENNLKRGGTFNYRMEAKDGSMGFDFGGIYDEVLPGRHIAYTMGDGRKVQINFSTDGKTTSISESFEAEETNSLEMQQSGWQAIIDNFRRYAEAAESETLGIP